MNYLRMVFLDKHRLDALSNHGRVSVTDGPFAEINEQIGGSFDVRPIEPVRGSRSDSGDRPH